MAKADIRICPYAGCPYPNHEINIASDAYIKVNKRYYHPQCKLDEEETVQRTQQEKSDIMSFLDLWNQHISNTVNFAYLRKILYEYISRGVSTEYLLFCLQYVIKNRLNLTYPNGFKYYIDMGEIKQAYMKTQTKGIRQDSFFVKENDAPPAEKKYPAPKTFKGFASILGDSQ